MYRFVRQYTWNSTSLNLHSWVTDLTKLIWIWQTLTYFVVAIMFSRSKYDALISHNSMNHMTNCCRITCSKLNVPQNLKIRNISTTSQNIQKESCITTNVKTVKLISYIYNVHVTLLTNDFESFISRNFSMFLCELFFLLDNPYWRSWI
jgi:hypothetical protein